MVPEESRREGSKAPCQDGRRTGQAAGAAAPADRSKLTRTSAVRSTEKPGSSNCPAAEQLFLPRPGGRSWDTFVHLSPVLLMRPRPQGCSVAFLPSGILALPGSSPASLAIRSVPRSLRKLPAVTSASPGRRPPARLWGEVPLTAGWAARVPRPLSPNGSPRSRREPASPALRDPPPSDLPGHGRPRRAGRSPRSLPLPPRRGSPAPTGELRQEDRSPAPCLASPRSPPPCLLLWSLGLMN